MDGSAFQPTGKTHVLLATTTSDMPISLYSDVGDVNQYRVYNSGVMTVFLTVLPTAQEVTDSLGIPELSEPTYSIPITPGAVEIFSGPDDAWAAVYTQAGEAMVYITPGRGM